MPEPRLLTIFVRFGVETYPEAEAHLDALFASQLPRVARDVLVVDNQLPPGVVESRPGRTVIGGDNRSWEFSSIDLAVAHYGPALWRYDLVNIVTSAFEQLYVAYLERFLPPVVSAIVGRRACLGHIDCYNEPIEILGCPSQHWLRSCFLMLPVQELLLLRTAVSAPSREPWFSGRPEQPFAAEAPISERFQRYIIDWLVGKDIGQGVSWHRTLALDEGSLPMFEEKARAILNEHLLGVRLRAAGCRLVDVTWLSSVLPSGRSVDLSTPWWEQLAGRDRDAVRVQPGEGSPAEWREPQSSGVPTLGATSPIRCSEKAVATRPAAERPGER